MFSIAVDRTHTVLLVSYTDKLQAQDIADLDRLVRPIAETEALVAVVVDLRQVTGIEVPLEKLVERAKGKSMLPGRKLVFVAADEPILTMSRQYAAYRERSRPGAILVVPDLEAAWAAIGIEPPSFGFR